MLIMAAGLFLIGKYFVNESSYVSEPEPAEPETVPEPAEPEIVTEPDQETGTEFLLEITSSDWYSGVAFVEHEGEKIFSEKYNGTIGETVTHEYQFIAEVGDQLTVELYSDAYVSVKLARKGFFVNERIMNKIVWDYALFRYEIKEDDV